MPARRSTCKRSLSTLFTLAGLTLAALPCHTGLAQDSAFLACDRHADRGQRIACLEDALEAARAESEPSPAPVGPAPVAEDGDPSLSDRPRDFGRREPARVSTDPQGREQLEDTIARLDKRNDRWIITLSGGQVWRQEFPRTLNLRQGDEITIYQDGFGNGYRLSAKRLSGFIRVARVR